MYYNNLVLDRCENFDGIVEKVLIENDKKIVTIVLKQWRSRGYVLSEMKFIDVIFQSLPDISSFNLITEIRVSKGRNSAMNELKEYLSNNPSLVLSETEQHIQNKIIENSNLLSYHFVSGCCKNWFIICPMMTLTETTL